jgi:hypothetical protein
MTDYGKGDVLGAATSLPLTSAGILLVDTTHPIVIIGFIVITCISLIVLIAYISRYLINKNK